MLGLSPPRGILLHGPPGCAKVKFSICFSNSKSTEGGHFSLLTHLRDSLQTTLARAAAGAAGIAFLSLSPADVYASSYVGEAEAIVRRAFSLARSASPCILFFDEIDSIVSVSSSNSSGMDRNNSAEGTCENSQTKQEQKRFYSILFFRRKLTFLRYFNLNTTCSSGS